MIAQTFTMIDETRATAVEADVDSGRVLLTPDEVERALGWTLQPEGFCRAGICVPVRQGAGVIRGEAVDLAALADLLGRPLALDIGERAAAVGASAQDRASALASLEAPDFTLPDLHGRPHSLSDYRGKKVFLAVWASW
jgi:hypothetical protein